MMDNLYIKIKDMALHKDISKTVQTIFLCCTIITILIIWILYKYISSVYILENMKYSTREVLNSIDSNIIDVIESANSNYSLLLKNGVDNLTKPMKNIKIQKMYDKNLFTLVDTYPNLRAIYFTDFDHYLYGVDKTGKKQLKIQSLKKASWYEEALQKRGSFILKYNAGDIFKKDYKENFISMIRVVNSLETQKPVGFAILNIPISSIEHIVNSVFTEQMGKDKIALYNENGELISGEINFSSSKIDNLLGKVSKEHRVYSFHSKGYITMCMEMSKYGWKLVVSKPLRGQSKFMKYSIQIMVLVLGVSLGMLCCCSRLIIRSISVPIQKLIYAMRGVKEREFVKVEVEYPESEIGILQTHFNHMMEEIQFLLQQLIREQKVKRRMEILALQDQIKPHFLYNTLEAIGYMALTEEPNDVYSAIETLGAFYRQFLSNGNEVILLKTEIQIVKDYISLLKLRYNSLFEIFYELSIKNGDILVPKLILQPLIENCVYHGIKPIGGGGKIKLTIKEREQFLYISIKDNGIGMEERILKKIKEEEGDWKDDGGIGLLGTMKRLKIFYGGEEKIDIRSKKGEGTEIILWIPWKDLLNNRGE